MDHFQVEVGEVNKPLGLLMIESLGRTEVGNVFVVGKDLHGMDDSKEFSVIDVVVSFCWGE